MWVGEKLFNHRGQEETFLRFRLDEVGKILPPFTFEKKKFVTPMQSLGNYTAPPTGAAAYEDGDPAR